MTKKNQSYRIVSMLAVVLFISLFVISITMLWRQSKISTDALIVQEINHLKQIFEKIDQDCKIIDFEHVKNYIDFLTVKEFVGSEVGAMNLAWPNLWKGPYLRNNPTIQERQYIVFHAKDGYYILPGDGVLLGNGKKIGVDFLINQETDMSKLLADSDRLLSTEGQLAVKINVVKGKFKKAMLNHIGYVE